MNHAATVTDHPNDVSGDEMLPGVDDALLVLPAHYRHVSCGGHALHLDTEVFFPDPHKSGTVKVNTWYSTTPPVQQGKTVIVRIVGVLLTIMYIPMRSDDGVVQQYNSV